MGWKRLIVWLRWFSCKTVAWRQFARTTIELIQAQDCSHARSRWFLSLNQINLIGIYEILEDLIRFPPY